MDTHGASSMVEAMPCGLGFHVGDLRDGLDFVQCAWARGNRPCKRACDAAFPDAHARISGAVPQISLLSQTAAIARSSRIYWVFISGSRASGFGGKAFLNH